MQTLILTLYIIVCVLLVILILLQSGKEGMGVIFGGGNSSVFGSTGAGGILAKLTAFMAVVFVITALSYTYVTSSKPTGESTILDVKIEEAPATSTPATPPAQSVSPSAESSQSTSQAPAANANPAPDSANMSAEPAVAPSPSPTSPEPAPKAVGE